MAGRRDFCCNPAQQLEPGDVFSIGLSLIRVIFVGTLGRDGVTVEVAEDKGTKFRREEAKAEKRRGKLESQQSEEGDELEARDGLEAGDD